jgi:hypothetical protein
MSEGNVVAIKSGTITSGALLVDVVCGPPEARQLRLSVIVGAGEKQLLAPTETVRLKRKRFVLHFPLPTGRPLRSVVPVLCDEAGQILPVEEISEDYILSNLLPIHKNDLSKLIFHKSSRIDHLETLRFVLEQVADSEENNVFERIEAVKILAYRVLEFREIEAIDRILDRTIQALTWVPQLPDEYGIAKTSRYQSRISILYLRYLLFLFKGDGQAVMTELDAIANSAGFVAECPIAAYNLCLGLLAAGLIRARAGEAAAAKAHWEEVIRIFRVAASTMPARKPATFVELTVSFEAAKQAAWALEELRSGRPRDGTSLTPEKLAKSFSRLRSEAACAFMAERLVALTDGLKPAPAT